VGRSSRRRVKVCQQQQSSSYDREASVCSLFKRPISECGIRCITLVVSWSQMSVDRRPVWRIPAVSSASCTRPWSKTCSMRDFRGSSAAWDEAIAGAIPVTCRSSGRRIQLTRCRLRRSAAGVAYCASSRPLNRTAPQEASVSTRRLILHAFCGSAFYLRISFAVIRCRNV
jgi:hypothetical protein